MSWEISVTGVEGGQRGRIQEKGFGLRSWSVWNARFEQETLAVIEQERGKCPISREMRLEVVCRVGGQCRWRKQ